MSLTKVVSELQYSNKVIVNLTHAQRETLYNNLVKEDGDPAGCWGWKGYTLNGKPAFLGINARGVVWVVFGNTFSKRQRFEDLCGTKNCLNPHHFKIAIPATEKYGLLSSSQYHYLKNKPKHAAYIRKHRDELTEWYYDIKKKLKCLRCGISDFRVLEFAHRDARTKVNNVSFMVARRWSKERILAEMAKCDPLCKNCHMIDTFENFYVKYKRLRKSPDKTNSNPPRKGPQRALGLLKKRFEE